MPKSGILSLQRLSSVEKEALIDYLAKTKNIQYLDFMDKVLTEEFLIFLDVFSGEVLKVPSREEVLKAITTVKIYIYCKDRGFTEEAYERASKIFDKRKVSIKRICEKYEETMIREEDVNE